jgi:DNA-binding NarL/FixJ family response regulator
MNKPYLKTQMKKPEIIIVDDHQIFRQGIKSIITLENIATVIGVATNGEEFLQLLATTKPDIVLLDIDMPTMNGLEATEKALQLRPDLKIIAFTMFGDEEYFVRMIELGAVGYILKSSDISELEKTIRIVMNGEKYFSNPQYKKENKHPGFREIKKLTEPEGHAISNKNNADLFPQWF